MKKIETFSRATAKEVNEAAREALEAVAKRFGISVMINGGKFDDMSFTPKITFSAVKEDASGNTIDKRAADFRKYCNMHGLKGEMLFSLFQISGKTYKIVGLEPRRRTNPIVCEGAGGKLYIFPAQTIVDLNEQGRLIKV